MGEGGRWERASVGAGVSSPRFPVFDLQRGGQYRFRTRSVNKHGVSEPSEASGLLELAPPPGQSAPSVDLHWEAPPGGQEVLGYYLYYSLTGSGQWNTINNKPISSTRFTAHGLQTQQDYVFRVKAVGRAGTSAYSQQSPPVRVRAAIRAPGPPSGLSLLTCSGSGMVLSWRAPACDGGSPVLGYYLDQRGPDQDPWREVNQRPAETRLHHVSDLAPGASYQFRVFGANLVGLGAPSGPSEAFLCEAWTGEQPGPPYDLQPLQVRSDSLLLRWVPPLYLGASPLIGYQLHVSQDDQSERLKTGQTYRFRVSAVNQAGVGGASLPTEPITALTPPGTREVEAGVDHEGRVFLSYEVPEATPTDSTHFLWSRKQREAIAAERATLQDRGNRSVLTFMAASQEDLGLYSVELSDRPGLSSSYTLTEAELQRLSQLSLQIRNPRVGLRLGWQVEVTEDGAVRLWLQTEPLSAEAELRLVLNDREIASTPRRRWRLDRAGGLVEVMLDPLGAEDQGSYTAQLRDGRSRGQFTLLLVEQREAPRPYFLEGVSWEVTEECGLVIRCKVVLRHLSVAASVSRGRGLDQDPRAQPGSSRDAVWVDLRDPADSDQGRFSLELFDGLDRHARHLDLTGPGGWGSSCRAASLWDQGLPDTVAIMEGKSLCLTCLVEGDPPPEATWLRNGVPLPESPPYSTAQQGAGRALTITMVTAEDSGTYTVCVLNLHGGETAQVTVSVYGVGETPPANALRVE
uniref:Myomesin 3 n=1 Tax=Gadus morhua TaxID=8049 RepID=A0A8C4ZFM7_GADMO